MNGVIRQEPCPIQKRNRRFEPRLKLDRPKDIDGLGKRLMRTAIQLVSEAPSIHWVDLRVFAHNRSARSLYEQLGLREIGTLLDRFRIGETSIDDVLMTLAV